MALVHRFAWGRIELLEVDADPSGAISAPIGSEATLNVSPGTKWMNLDGGTTWLLGPGLMPDYLGLRSDATAVGPLAGWTDLATAVPIGAPVVALADAALQGPTNQRVVRFTPQTDSLLVRVSGLVKAVAAGEGIQGLNLNLEWGTAAQTVVTGSTDFRVGLHFLDAAGEGLRGVAWEIDGGYMLTNQTFVRVGPTAGTGGANDIVTTAWDAMPSIMLANGTAIANVSMWLRRNADNTIDVWSGVAGRKPLPHYNALAASAGAGFVGVVCYANAGITARVPTVSISSQLAAPAALPWV